MEDNKFLSYTAASGVFPIKIVFDADLIKTIAEEKKILPVHVQINPTNHCNLSCAFCSCSARDKQLEMSFEKIKEAMTKFKNLGCKSITVTGGGEPLMHPQINEVINFLWNQGIQIGLVTNGWLLSKLNVGSLQKIVWIRISLGDGRVKEKQSREYWSNIQEIMKESRGVDWAFSYVVTEQPDFELIEKMIVFANKLNFTHVRLVNDIFIADELRGVMNQIKLWAKKNKVNDELVIYQDRAEWSKGTKKCLISLLKPVLDPAGNILPCCGTQYALATPSRDYEPSMRMGSVEDIERIWGEQKYFDGSVCVKCYYSHYNSLLNSLMGEIKHKAFL